MIIEIIDPIECRVDKKNARALIPCLSYKAYYWKQGRFKKERREYDKQIFSRKGKDHWYFYLGHLPRVRLYIHQNNLKATIRYPDWDNLPFQTPSLPGITFREDQDLLMHQALGGQRGVILSPTGTGKTLLQLGIISAFPNDKALILAHTQAIVNQTIDELEKFGYWTEVQKIGAGEKYEGKFWNRIIVATMQSFVKINPEDYCDKFPIVIVDEGHHISKFDGTYAKILSQLLSVVRLAFTATEPTDTQAKLALEGLIGPVIGNFTINEASEKGILAKPKIKIIKSEFDHSVRELRSYRQVYEEGIVQNISRNKQIVDITLKHKEKDEVILIFVNQIEHGENLVYEFERKGVSVPFIQGSMPSTERENIKKSMIKRRRKIAIATTAWKEGINIPSLNVIVNAGGGKSEISVLQSIGRGLRRTDDKEEVIIYDFFDPSSTYLIGHFGERISLYTENQWI